jgi:outer membrane protein OmpA-like peptidoglycan-associated protein
MPDSKLPLPETAPGVASVDPIPAAPQIGVPPAPVLSDKAAVGLSPKTAGLRLTFAAGEAELSPDSAAAIKQTVGKAPSGDNVTFEVFAYASGKSDDQSSARRLSLSRAMAVRGVLTAGGIPSARIFIRAMGENAGDGPADRVDLNISGPSKAATQ